MEYYWVIKKNVMLPFARLGIFDTLIMTHTGTGEVILNLN